MHRLLILLALTAATAAGAQENRSSCKVGNIDVMYSDQPGLIILEEIEDLILNSITWINIAESSVIVECTDPTLVFVKGSVTLRIVMRKGLSLTVLAGGQQVFPAKD